MTTTPEFTIDDLIMLEGYSEVMDNADSYFHDADLRAITKSHEALLEEFLDAKFPDDEYTDEKLAEIVKPKTAELLKKMVAAAQAWKAAQEAKNDGSEA